MLQPRVKSLRPSYTGLYPWKTLRSVLRGRRCGGELRLMLASGGGAAPEKGRLTLLSAWIGWGDGESAGG